MNRNIILLTILTTVVGFFVIGKKATSLVSTVLKQNQVQTPSLYSSPLPSTPSYNAPKELKYDGGTDLKKELDSVDPQVLDSDFE